MFPRFLTIVLKPIDNICNLECEYCYARSEFGQYSNDLSKLKPLIEEWFPILLKKLSLASELKKVHFVWQGGEPLLLPKDLFEKAINWQKSFLREDIRWSNAVQTNGLLLNNDYAHFLSNLGIYLGVSIDGPDYKNNRMRFGSRKIHNKVLENIHNLSVQRIPHALFFVIHEDNCKEAVRIMDFIIEMNPPNGVAFPPRFTSDVSFINPKDCADFLIELFDLWWPHRPITISIFEHIIEGLQGRVPILCYLSGKCSNFISIDANANVYSTCEVHRDLKIGNILNDSMDTIKEQHRNRIQQCFDRFENRSLFELLELNRKYIYFQGKGCPNRISDGKDPYTAVFAELITHIDRAMKTNGRKN